MIEVFFISLKGSSPGQPWMIPSVTSNSLHDKDWMAEFQRGPSPVQTHLSIQSNLVSAADEPELLAAHVVGRPRARVGIVRARSVGFAELALRDVFAAVIILTDVFLQKLTFHI